MRRGYPLIHHVHVLLYPVFTRYWGPFLHVIVSRFYTFLERGGGMRSVDWVSVMASLGELAMR